MTQDEIIRMAREACNPQSVDPVMGGMATFTLTELKRFAALVAAHVTEACAKECDYWAEQAEARGYTCKGETHIDGFGDGAAACAAAIRARGEK